MRNALAILLVLASLVTVAACGKKQAPQSPANNTETQAAPDDDREEQDVNKPDDTDSDSMRTSDPCEGGE